MYNVPKAFQIKATITDVIAAFIKMGRGGFEPP